MVKNLLTAIKFPQIMLNNKFRKKKSMLYKISRSKQANLTEKYLLKTKKSERLLNFNQ